MKLRLRDNNIRFRLTQPEVGELASSGSVRCETRLGRLDQEVLSYGLQTDADRKSLGLVKSALAITVLIPKTWVEDWQSTDRVGFEGSIDVGGGGELEILVEKDFRRLSRHSEQGDGGAYPHPRERNLAD